MVLNLLIQFVLLPVLLLLVSPWLYFSQQGEMRAPGEAGDSYLPTHRQLSDPDWAVYDAHPDRQLGFIESNALSRADP